MRRYASGWPRALVVLLFGGAAAIATLQLVPASQHRLGPSIVATEARLGPGRTTLVLPPLGTISADTHHTPLSVEATLARIDLPRLVSSVPTAAGREHLRGEVEAGLRHAVAVGAVQLLLASVLIGAVAGALLPKRKWSDVALGGVGALLATGTLVSITAATYDLKAFGQPRYTGSLERAPEVLQAVSREVDSFDQVRSRYEVLADQLTDLFALIARPPGSPGKDSVTLLHISDIHSNPLGLEIATQLARAFRVDAVLDTGDLTSFGEPIEGSLATLVEDVPTRYLFVPGNHDSSANRRRIAAAANVTLLGRRPASVRGLEILGAADPTFTASGEISTEMGNRLRAASAEKVKAEVEKEQPDVLAVHDLRLARSSRGEVPLVLAGHTHERSLGRQDGTVTLTVGSTGATGLGSFTVEANADYDAEVIYFRSEHAVAIDYIRLKGVSSDFEIERQTLGSGPEDAFVRASTPAGPTPG